MKRKGKMIVRRAAMSRRDAVSRLLLLTLFLFSFVGGTRADEPTPRRTPTMTKDIEGYGEGENHWYLIASPIEEVAPVDVENLLSNLLSNDYDLYWFDHAPETDDGLEWRNYKVVGQEFQLVSGKGYLYASKENVTLTFTGMPYDGDGEVTLTKTDGAHFEGWNLVGNPFNVSAFVDRNFYVMNDEGSEIVPGEGEVEPMEGIFVVATEDGETMTFTPVPSEGYARGASFALNLSRGSVLTSSKTIDRVIVRFGEGRMLPKFQLNPNHTKVYIPMDGKDYAVVRSKGMGEMPVNFKADANGSYTLSLSAEGVSFDYLHLIDSKTGNDIDLLETPSYTFEASTTDDASRFKIVFAQDGDTKTNALAGVSSSPLRNNTPRLPSHGEEGNQSAWEDNNGGDDPNPIPYIAADGTTASCSDYTVLDGSTSTSTTTLSGGWYVVTGSNVSYSAGLEFDDETDDTHIILADGAKLSINAGDGCGISVENGKSLYIYGQTASTGKLITDYGDVGIFAKTIFIYGGDISITNPEKGIYTKDITINGGTITTSDCNYGIYSDNGDITINGGTISTSDCTNGIYLNEGGITINDGEINASGVYYGIYAAEDITIKGGTVTASGNLYGIGNYGDITITDGTVTASGGESGIYQEYGNITISGGTVTASGDDDSGINNESGYITISGGKVTANGGSTGISSYHNIFINGGEVTAKANKTNSSYGDIWTQGGNITITSGTVNATSGNGNGITAIEFNDKGGDIILAGGTVTASSYYGDVTVAAGLTYSDGTNTYLGTLTSEQKDAIKNKTLAVSAAKLSANQAPDGYYWTTFYFGGTGFAIDSDENACAYTATYSNENNEKKLTLHKLGKVIPAGTAVIIVDNDESISMTTSTAGAENTVSNHLKGVDVSTPLASLGEGTFYVLGKVGNDFGFFEYTGTDLNMPARKAYLQLPVSAGRSLTMVLGEETGIVDADLKSASHESGILNPLQRGSYTLSGQRVAQPTKGLYIVNGKKRIMN